MGFCRVRRFSHGRENHGDGLVDVRFFILGIDRWWNGGRQIPGVKKCSTSWPLNFSRWTSASDGGPWRHGARCGRSSSFSFTATSSTSPWPKTNWYTGTRPLSTRCGLFALKAPCGSSPALWKLLGALSGKRWKSAAPFQLSMIP